MWYITYSLIVLAFVVLGIYIKSTYTICRSRKRLDGKTAIVTGGTAGMGLRIAEDFTARGARVIIACPFEKEGAEGLRYIVKKTNSKNVEFKLLDLSSIDSIRKFADDVIQHEERIDILVNNAGVIFSNEYVTKDGMSFTMQVNFFGHFLLTLLLLPLLNKTGISSEPARIVNVTSLSHYVAKIDLPRMNDIEHWTPFKIYANSKLCLILFARELTRRLKNSNVVINSADPGIVATSILKYKSNFANCMLLVIVVLFRVILKTPWEGAQTAVFVALNDETGAVSGEMFFNCKISQAASSAYDEDLARKVWDKSVKLVKLSKEELNTLFK